ncbi:MAG: 30S ribosomal protein S2, partial [Alphaproteobacteria bacterium]
QASEPVAEAARASAQYYINHRWLGGTLTNWKTISNSIQRLRQLSEQLAEGAKGLTKKERLKLDRELGKLELSLGGIKDMGGVPDIIIVIDTNKEALALQEAKKLRIPIVAVVDTNCDPSLVDYAIPGNDDASRAIALYCDLFARAILDGLEQASVQAGVDLGAMDEPDVSLPELEAVEDGASSLEVSDAAEENGSDESEQKV